MPQKPPDVVQRAKANRANMMGAEARMWSLLRNRRLGHKFRRQHPIGQFVVDFACPSKHLVIEVDGSAHETREQACFDSERTAYLNSKGWRVFRVPNAHVSQSPHEVEAAIRAMLEV